MCLSLTATRGLPLFGKRSALARKAIQLYQQMRQTCIKSENHVFVAVLKACAAAKDLLAGRRIHIHIQQIVEKPDLLMGNCVMDMCCKCGSLEDAGRLLKDLQSEDVVTMEFHDHRVCSAWVWKTLALYGRKHQETTIRADAVTFIYLLQACAHIGALDQVKQIHLEVRGCGLENERIIGTCLVDMYAKYGVPEGARQLFDKPPVKDVVTWNSMSSGYTNLGLGHEALSLRSSMCKEGIMSPDAFTFVSVLRASATL